MSWRSRSVTVAAAALCAFGTHTVVAQQAARPMVVVMVFNSHAAAADAKQYEGLGTGIAAYLGSELSGNPALQVVERERVRQALARNPAPTVMMDRETAIRVAQQLGAQHVIVGGFTPDASGNVRIDARVVNADTKTVELSERVQDRADNIGAIVARIASSMTRGMGVTPAAAGSPATLPLRAFATYGHALELEGRGDKGAAAELFTAVLRDHPDFAPAKAGLSRVKPGS